MSNTITVAIEPITWTTVILRIVSLIRNVLTGTPIESSVVGGSRIGNIAPSMIRTSRG